MGNGVSERLLAALVDPSLLTEHANYLRLTFIRSARAVTSSTGTKSRGT